MKRIRIAATLASWCVLSMGLLAGTLPAQGPAAGDAAEAAKLRDILRVPSGDPQLRIHINGHTGVVRAVAFTPDSTRLCTAGLDKVVQVWNLRSAPRDLQGGLLRERTLRWQVARGLRGSIQAVASAPSDGLLALGGYGAMYSLGEILLVDPVQGTLARVLEGHLQPICSLGFSGDGNWLASMDTEGRAFLWKRGAWPATALYAPDEKTYGLEKARIIAQQPKLRPIAVVGNTHVVLPVYIDKEEDGRPMWKIQRIKLDDLGDVHTFDTVHHGVVTALAVAADGGRMASADIEGNLFLGDLRGERVVPLKPGATVLSLAFSPDGRSLVVGTAIAGDSRKAEMQVWDVASHTRRRHRPTDDHVHACAVSPDGKRIAYVGGRDYEVFVEPLDGDGPRTAVGGASRRILKVAFAKEKPYYRVAFGSRLNQRGFNDYGDLEQSFDTQRLELAHEPPNPADWIPADFGCGDWEAQRRKGGFLQLYRNKELKGTAVFDSALEEGAPRAFCWIPDEQGNPFAIAVGSDLQNSIYVFRLAEKGHCPILRHFRGHYDYVTSLGLSRDRKYLVSGSADGTVGVWNLAGVEKGRESRWGASLAVVRAGASLPAEGDARPKAAAKADQLLVREIHPAGPLYFKGVRRGDAIGEIRWFADREGRDLRGETRPERILAALGEIAWGTQVSFQVSRDGAARPWFQLLPAWQPLASLFVSVGKEWAFWTPEGYYDASINGYTLFGWQVNRGLGALPSFYRADQFRRKLEQPGVLERLLPAGSLQEAFGQARLPPRGELQNAVPEQIAITPSVEIVRPRSGLESAQNAARVAVKIDARADVKIVGAKVYANGVVAPRGTLIAERAEGDRVVQTYEWQVPLPADETNLIQVFAGTDGNVTGLDEIHLRRIKPVWAARPRMHIRAVGINTYADSNIPPLSFPVADAQAVLDVLKARAAEMYAIESASLLTGADATPQKWRECLQTLAKQLKDSAGPDDLIVLFLAGHGWADTQSGEYYYIGHRYKLADLGKSYAECISWNDFRILGEIPCRKLVLLDTCHSGAIQPLRARNVKAAVRQLQDDVILTLAASKGEQQAAEHRAWKHGVFTKCLLESLEGKGGIVGRRDVTLKDVVEYVEKTVPRITGELTKGAKTQQPTAAPDELMGYIRLPLTRTPPPGASSSSNDAVPSKPKP